MPEPTAAPPAGTRVSVRPGSFGKPALEEMHAGKVGVVIPESAASHFARAAADLTKALGLLGDEPGVFVLYDAPWPTGSPWISFHRAGNLVALPDSIDPERAREETHVENSPTDPDDLVELQRTPGGDRA